MRMICSRRTHVPFTLPFQVKQYNDKCKECVRETNHATFPSQMQSFRVLSCVCGPGGNLHEIGGIQPKPSHQQNRERNPPGTTSHRNKKNPSSYLAPKTWPTCGPSCPCNPIRSALLNARSRPQAHSQTCTVPRSGRPLKAKTENACHLTSYVSLGHWKHSTLKVLLKTNWLILSQPIPLNEKKSSQWSAATLLRFYAATLLEQSRRWRTTMTMEVEGCAWNPNLSGPWNASGSLRTWLSVSAHAISSTLEASFQFFLWLKKRWMIATLPCLWVPRERTKSQSSSAKQEGTALLMHANERCCGNRVTWQMWIAADTRQADADRLRWLRAAPCWVGFDMWRWSHVGQSSSIDHCKDDSDNGVVPSRIELSMLTCSC